jgi:hypothetical protein
MVSAHQVIGEMAGDVAQPKDVARIVKWFVSQMTNATNN